MLQEVGEYFWRKEIVSRERWLLREKGHYFERKVIASGGRVLHFKLTIPEFPYNILPVSCGDIGILINAWWPGKQASE
jgi:hypothetical protein